MTSLRALCKKTKCICQRTGITWGGNLELVFDSLKKALRKARCNQLDGRGVNDTSGVSHICHPGPGRLTGGKDGGDSAGLV